MVARKFALLLLVFLIPRTGAAEGLSCRTGLVPVERLLANLQAQTETSPPSWQTYFNLGRAYAIAFARKTATLEACGEFAVLTDRGDIGEQNLQPDIVAGTETSAADVARYRAGAMAAYARAIALTPDVPLPHLGYAWVLEQSGRSVEAIAEYRSAIALSWPADRDANERRIKPDGSPGVTPGFPVGYVFLSDEAIRHLIPLLDRARDADEVADLEAKRAQIARGSRYISPIVIPLRGDLRPADLLDDTARVTFDLDGFGARRWTWVTPDAGWLVFDPQGARRVTSGLQLFGNVTFWLFWNTGYDALRALDDNADGWLDGAELAGLALWRDANGDGVSQPDEVSPLSTWGIAALSTAHTTGAEDPDVLAWSEAGVRFSDGRTRATFDLLLQTR